MKVLLAAINCSYNHTSLAIPCLQAACMAWMPSFPLPGKREFHIRQDATAVAQALAGERPDLIGFSCYIFNISLVMSTVRILREILPDSTILFGGPEMADGGTWLMDQPGGPDYVIRGEGEKTFMALLGLFNGDSGNDPENINGLTWKRRGIAVMNPSAPAIEPMDDIPSPFASGFYNFERRFILIEASRGCPFNCGFCLSGGDRLREFSLERVLSDIDIIASHGVKEIRFVDRTFNARPRRAVAILDYIERNHPAMMVHVELEPSLLASSELLARLDNERVHAEIGLQELSPDVLRSVSRKPLTPRALATVRGLCRDAKASIHLDLIAGLPGGTLEGLYANVDKLTGFAPRELQLEILKALRGTAIRESAEINCDVEPPYAVTRTSTMTDDEIRDAHLLSRLVDMFYNDPHLGPVVICARRLLVRRDGFWPLFSQWWKKQGLNAFGIGKMKRFDLLLRFFNTLVIGGIELPEEARKKIVGQWVFRRLCHGKLRPRRDLDGAEYVDGGKLPKSASRLREVAGPVLSDVRSGDAGAWCVWRFDFDPAGSKNAGQAADYVWIWDNPLSPTKSDCFKIDKRRKAQL